MRQKNLDIYGSKPIPWSRARDQLDASATETEEDAITTKTTYWLAAARPDGRPHVTAVGALWVDGSFYFTSGAGTRKSRNLVENPNCVITVALDGLDLVVEGMAAKVTDDATVARLAERYAAQGWPASA